MNAQDSLYGTKAVPPRAVKHPMEHRRYNEYVAEAIAATESLRASSRHTNRSHGNKEYYSPSGTKAVAPHTGRLPSAATGTTTSADRGVHCGWSLADADGVNISLRELLKDQGRIAGGMASTRQRQTPATAVTRLPTRGNAKVFTPAVEAVELFQCTAPDQKAEALISAELREDEAFLKQFGHNGDNKKQSPGYVPLYGALAKDKDNRTDSMNSSINSKKCSDNNTTSNTTRHPVPCPSHCLKTNASLEYRTPRSANAFMGGYGMNVPETRLVPIHPPILPDSEQTSSYNNNIIKNPNNSNKLKEDALSYSKYATINNNTARNTAFRPLPEIKKAMESISPCLDQNVGWITTTGGLTPAEREKYNAEEQRRAEEEKRRSEEEEARTLPTNRSSPRQINAPLAQVPTTPATTTTTTTTTTTAIDKVPSQKETVKTEKPSTTSISSTNTTTTNTTTQHSNTNVTPYDAYLAQALQEAETQRVLREAVTTSTATKARPVNVDAPAPLSLNTNKNTTHPFSDVRNDYSSGSTEVAPRSVFVTNAVQRAVDAKTEADVVTALVETSAAATRELAKQAVREKLPQKPKDTELSNNVNSHFNTEALTKQATSVENNSTNNSNNSKQSSDNGHSSVNNSSENKEKADTKSPELLLPSPQPSLPPSALLATAKPKAPRPATPPLSLTPTRSGVKYALDVVAPVDFSPTVYGVRRPVTSPEAPSSPSHSAYAPTYSKMSRHNAACAAAGADRGDGASADGPHPVGSPALRQSMLAYQQQHKGVSTMSATTSSSQRVLVTNNAGGAVLEVPEGTPVAARPSCYMREAIEAPSVDSHGHEVFNTKGLDGACNAHDYHFI